MLLSFGSFSLGEEGSEGEESGLASDLSGDDSHDMEGEWAVWAAEGVLVCSLRGGMIHRAVAGCVVV